MTEQAFVLSPLVGIDNHQNQKRDKEDNRQDNRDTVEVLLNNTRSGLGRVHGTGNHLGHTGTFAGMKQNEDDQSNTGKYQQDQKNYH